MTPPNAKKPIRILLIDDHLVVREGLRLLLESRAGLTVVGEAGNRREALAITSRERPDIILLDLDLGRAGSGLDFMPELLSAARNSRILLLTAVRDPEAHQQAVQLGAMGLVSKEKGSEELFKAIEKVYAGEVWLDRSLTARVLSGISHPGDKKSPEAEKIASLTEREREVMALISEGLKNKDIADRLFISETTVRHHLTSIFSKLDVSNRFELIILLHKHKLAKPRQA
jgi:two-component system nitrate/nitrite response regulator NarL